MADRDFTEFCHFCKEPLLICELVRDVGQNLYDKATTVTRRLAARSGVHAYLLGYEVHRSWSIQREIDDLNQRVIELEQRTPPTAFRVRSLYPICGELRTVSPNEWAQWLLLSHRRHHATCRRATLFPVHRERFLKAQYKHPMHVPSLFDGILL